MLLCGIEFYPFCYISTIDIINGTDALHVPITVYKLVPTTHHTKAFME